MYEYTARLIRVIDGDTVVLDLDLGCRVHIIETIRILGINAPEVRGETKAAGDAATEWLEELLTDKPLIVRTHKDDGDKYGRLLGDIWLPDATNVSVRMFDAGHAVWKDY